MFRKILIANRGEIAVRIARTARRLGIATVAVHSEADAGARHVLACDEAVAIGPAPVAQSYLKADRILAAAKATGAQAIHPGYGFLSENPEFAEAVAEAGLTFIGPPANAIRAMGLKDAAKRLMEAAGVPVTPGYHGENQDPDFLAGQAAEIGYPVLVKASAGGGGKGMRKVDRAEDFARALQSARSEAASSFGHDHVIIERFILNPRHIEVQVFADGHGNTVHLFERDCSAQRRHQKVIEEAPAPGMTEEVREAMTGAAVRAAEAVGYRGAGTVEFIVDGSGPLRPDGFWFMEMNTRLQVEHPVTEAVTGLDLVEWQLRVAAGEPLPLRQDQIALNGHALEVRIYAEDAARDFMPATGKLTRLALPGDLARTRIDSGVTEGDTVTPHYDPMIAKIITHGPDREAAFTAMEIALAACHAEGPATNIAFLERLIRHPEIRAGKLDTGLIGRDLAALTQPPEATPADLALAGAALSGLLRPAPLAGWRGWGSGATHLQLARATGPGEAALDEITLRLTGGGIALESASGTAGIAAKPLGGTLWQVGDAAGSRRVHLHQSDGSVTLARDGGRLTFSLRDPMAAVEEAGHGGDSITAPLPGIVKSLNVSPGATVAAGDVLAVMEAMKMEHSLLAPRNGTVAEVAVRAGEQVEEGALLITLEPEA
ncbi:MAG: acetyl/propionyl/methylcrotonyl-CoA carboxylase subunit alpha [Proteobacteria bacterium]|nr:acetyl/propionyl/methylcrotonyl-CoA carboxylase subunit alpha [Pseudomonadota bacterium]